LLQDELEEIVEEEVHKEAEVAPCKPEAKAKSNKHLD